MKITYIFMLLFLISLSCINIKAQTVVASSSEIDYTQNDLITDDTRLGFLIPSILLLITIVCFAIDFGVVGVGSACLIGLIVLSMLGVVVISWYWLLSFIIITIIILSRLAG